MKTLLISDLHLTDNPKDEYRWKIFEWLEKVINDNSVKVLNILGDITERKDKHSAALLLRFISNIIFLKENTNLKKINILKGNHDYIDREKPFFSFINLFDEANIEVITNLKNFKEKEEFFIPHGELDNQELIEDIKNCKYDLSRKYSTIFIHDYVNGATFKEGTKVENELDSSIFKEVEKVYAGHIHIPQKINNITYIGAPYHIDFGDNYNGRVLLVETGKETELFPDFLKKWSIIINSIEDLESYQFNKEDQVKIKVVLSQSDSYNWKETSSNIKEYLKNLEVDLCGLSFVVEKEYNERNKLDIKEIKSDFDILRMFGKKEDLEDKDIEIAKELMRVERNV